MSDTLILSGLPISDVLSSKFDLLSKFCKSSVIDIHITAPLGLLFPLFNQIRVSEIAFSISAVQTNRVTIKLSLMCCELMILI